MTPEVKQRIELIRRGEVPEGYERTPAGLMPKDWISGRVQKAKDVFCSVSSKGYGAEYEVLSATQERGVVPRSQVDIDIKYETENVSGYKKVDKGDFVISLRSFQGGIEHSEYTGLVSPAYTVLKPRVPIHDGYYKAYFKTSDFINRLNKGTYGIRDGKQIGFGDFGDMVIHYPPLPEQEKIAEILAAQDKVIELNDRIIEQLQLMKKVLLRKMFPVKGSNVPEVRFSGFTTPWEQRQFSELAETRRGLTYNPSNIRTAGIRVLRSSNIIEDQFVIGDEDVFVDPGAVNIPFAKQGDILITSANGSTRLVGKHSIIKKIPDKSAVPGGFMLLATANNPEFVDALMGAPWYSNFIALYVAGGNGAIGNLNKNDLDQQIVYAPSETEQKAIGGFFENLNNLITLHQRKRDEEKQKKKALMQLLLTGIVRV